MALVGKPFTGAPLATGAEWSVLHAPSSTGGVLGAYGGGDLAPSAVTTGSPAPDRTVRIAASATNGVLAAGVRATLAAAENAPALASNSSGQNRLDYVVARFDWDLETVVLAVVQGTPGANPVRPTLTQVPGDQWDEPLALVTVRNGVGVLSTTDVLDVRRWALRSAGAFQRDADLPAPGTAAFALVAGVPRFSNGVTWAPPWTSYVPVWTASGAPSIGNGTLTGRYQLIGKTLDLRIWLEFGSTTSGGIGPWAFTIPPGLLTHGTGEQQVDAKGWIVPEVRNYDGMAFIYAGTNVLYPHLPAAPGDSLGQVRNTLSGGAGSGIPAVAGNYPFVTGGNLALRGTLEIA